MQSTVLVLDAAASIDLITLDELKLALGLAGSTTQDAMLSDVITRSSAEIAAFCNNRVFGKERVTEIFTEVSLDCNRLFLSRYPITSLGDIEEIDNAGDVTLPPVMNGYLVDALWGKLTLRNGALFASDVSITYTGGYLLPQQAPPALKQATILLARESYAAIQRGATTEGVRMLSHKDHRIIFFDPNQANRQAAQTVGSAAQRAIKDLLTHFTRYEI